MAKMPGVLAVAERNLTEPPRVYTELALDQIEGNRAFFETTVAEAFDRYEPFRRAVLLARSTGEYAIGEDAFLRKLYHDELVELPLAKLLEIGEADLRKNQAELARLAAEIDPAATPAEVLGSLGKDHLPPARLLEATREMLDEIRAFIAERRLLTPPEARPVNVIETPPFMRATVSAAMDPAG